MYIGVSLVFVINTECVSLVQVALGLHLVYHGASRPLAYTLCVSEIPVFIEYTSAVQGYSSYFLSTCVIQYP